MYHLRDWWCPLCLATSVHYVVKPHTIARSTAVVRMPPDRPRLASAVVGATIPLYLEVGRKRVFASALDWPGWTRAGKDEKLAIEARPAYLPRYAVVPKKPRIDLSPPPEF